MAIFSDEERQRISAALNSRGINRPCPACGRWDITLVDGYLAHPVYANPGLDASAGAIPCIALTCQHCGYVAHHTLSGLGLLSP